MSLSTIAWLSTTTFTWQDFHLWPVSLKRVFCNVKLSRSPEKLHHNNLTTCYGKT
jgi:hypothetical protein